MSINVRNAKVGDVVHLFNTGSFTGYSEGFYTIVKLNKVAVFVSRPVDDKTITRKFSLKTGHELPHENRHYVTRSIIVESEADGQKRMEAIRRVREINALYSNIEEAARGQRSVALFALVDQLKNLIGDSE